MNREKTNVLWALLLTGIVVIVVHVLSFTYIRVYIIILERAAATAVAANSVGKQPTHTEKSFFQKTHTRSKEKGEKQTEKKNRTLYAVR
jgi:hypothetical protein